MSNLRNIQTCYITSPAGTNLAVLRSALQARGIRSVVPDDLTVGSDFQTKFKETIDVVDLVIGVLTRERRSEWVLFELGQAAALGKQILLLASRTSVQALSHIPGVLIIHATPANRDAIEFALDQLLAAPRPSEPTSKENKKSKPLGPETDHILQRLNNYLANNDHRGLEKLVADTLRRSGLELVVESGAGDRKADIAVWSDVLQPYVGNPLLIEIKGRLKDPSHLRAASRELSSLANSTGSQWGLLLFAQGPEKITQLLSYDPRVLVMSIPRLLEEMRRRPFEEIIRDERNARVHGRPA